MTARGALVLTFALALLPACNRSQSGVTPMVTPAAGPKSGPQDPPREVLEQSDRPVFGVVRVANPAATLSRIDAHILPSSMRGQLSAARIRTMLAATLSKTPAVAEKLPIDTPIACAFTDRRPEEPGPFACAFSYPGGAAALLADAGAESPRGSVVALQGQFGPIHVAPAGERVIVASHPDLLGALYSALAEQGTAVGKDPPDLEALVYPAALADDDGLRSFFAQRMLLRERSSSEDPVVAAFENARVDEGLELLRGYADLVHATFALRIGDDRTALRYRGTTRPDTTTAKSYVAHHGAGPIDGALLGGLPGEAILSVAFSIDLEQPELHFLLGPYLAMLARWHAESGAAARELVDVFHRTTDGRGAFAGLDASQTKVAAVLAFRRRANVDAIAELRKYFAGPRKSELVGPASKHLTLRFEANAGRTRGVPFDALTVARAEGSDWFATKERYLGRAPRLRVLFAQTADTLYVVAALDHEKQVLARVLEAAAGKNAMASDAREILAAHDRDHFLFMFDLTRLAQWQRRIGVPNVPSQARGAGRDDIAVSGRIISEREHEFTVAVSQGMIDVLRSR